MSVIRISTRTMTLLGAALLLAAVWLLPGSAWAATSGPPMPWDGPLTIIRDSLSGTIAHILVTAAIILTGLAFAFGEQGSGTRRVFGIALGGAVALGAITLMTNLGWAGALV